MAITNPTEGVSYFNNIWIDEMTGAHGFVYEFAGINLRYVSDDGRERLQQIFDNVLHSLGMDGRLILLPQRYDEYRVERDFRTERAINGKLFLDPNEIRMRASNAGVTVDEYALKSAEMEDESWEQFVKTHHDFQSAAEQHRYSYRLFVEAYSNVDDYGYSKFHIQPRARTAKPFTDVMIDRLFEVEAKLHHKLFVQNTDAAVFGLRPIDEETMRWIFDYAGNPLMPVLVKKLPHFDEAGISDAVHYTADLPNGGRTEIRSKIWSVSSFKVQEEQLINRKKKASDIVVESKIHSANVVGLISSLCEQSFNIAFVIPFRYANLRFEDKSDISRQFSEAMLLGKENLRKKARERGYLASMKSLKSRGNTAAAREQDKIDEIEELELSRLKRTDPKGTLQYSIYIIYTEEVGDPTLEDQSTYNYLVEHVFEANAKALLEHMSSNRFNVTCFTHSGVGGLLTRQVLYPHINPGTGRIFEQSSNALGLLEVYGHRYVGGESYGIPFARVGEQGDGPIVKMNLIEAYHRRYRNYRTDIANITPISLICAGTGGGKTLLADWIMIIHFYVYRTRFIIMDIKQGAHKYWVESELPFGLNKHMVANVFGSGQGKDDGFFDPITSVTGATYVKVEAKDAEGNTRYNPTGEPIYVEQLLVDDTEEVQDKIYRQAISGFVEVWERYTEELKLEGYQKTNLREIIDIAVAEELDAHYIQGDVRYNNPTWSISRIRSLNIPKYPTAIGVLQRIVSFEDINSRKMCEFYRRHNIRAQLPIGENTGGYNLSVSNEILKLAIATAQSMINIYVADDRLRVLFGSGHNRVRKSFEEYRGYLYNFAPIAEIAKNAGERESVKNLARFILLQGIMNLDKFFTYEMGTPKLVLIDEVGEWKMIEPLIVTKADQFKHTIRSQGGHLLLSSQVLDHFKPLNADKDDDQSVLQSASWLVIGSTKDKNIIENNLSAANIPINDQTVSALLKVTSDAATNTDKRTTSDPKEYVAMVRDPANRIDTIKTVLPDGKYAKQVTGGNSLYQVFGQNT